jgi:small subunit ribosomal protein S2e
MKSLVVAKAEINMPQIKPVQKQTRAGQRTRFKAIVVIGDSDGHIGLGIKTSKEVATAIRAAIIIAKLSVIPIRRGYWGSNLGEPHSLPVKESGKCGSVTVRVSTLCVHPTNLTLAAYSCSTWYWSRCLSSC